MKISAAKTRNFFRDVLKGLVMGAAFVVPGFSGGTVAVVLGVYNGFIDAIADLPRHFFRSLKYLLPFGIGITLGTAALVVPMRLGFEFIPLPLTCLFVGLMLGGVPPVVRDAGGRPSPAHIAALLISCAAAVGICFIPSFGAGGAMPYPALAAVGAVCACGCVVPGISGSMIAMIFGAYDDVIAAGSGIVTFSDIWGGLPVLGVFIAGQLVGFFSIALLMKFLLARLRKGTYYSILGFMAGSVFAAFYMQDPLITDALSVPVQIVMAVTLLAVGLAAGYIFCKVCEARETKSQVNFYNF